MTNLEVVHEKLRREGKLGPAARLSPTTAATTLLKGHQPPPLIDSPYVQTAVPSRA